MPSVDFSRLDAETVLVRGSLQEYRKRMDFFHVEQMLPLNASVFVLERILEFPLGLFTESGHRTFFALVLRNFFEAGLLTITRLATDRRGDLGTLLHFKNWVSDNVKAEYQEAFRSHLKRQRFEKQTITGLDKARRLRDARVAHVKKDFEISEDDRFDFQEFKLLVDSVNSVFDALSFNMEYSKLPPDYSPDVVRPKGVDSSSDIEKLLDGIAQGSAIFNLPEEDPSYWSEYRTELPQKDLEMLNRYRRRFGLREA